MVILRCLAQSHSPALQYPCYLNTQMYGVWPLPPCSTISHNWPQVVLYFQTHHKTNPLHLLFCSIHTKIHSKSTAIKHIVAFHNCHPVVRKHSWHGGVHQVRISCNPCWIHKHSIIVASVWGAKRCNMCVVYIHGIQSLSWLQTKQLDF
jgi:hypothetical protein